MLRFFTVDLREAVLDVAGQELMTADKVTLRMNAVVTFRVRDTQRAVNEVEDFKQALYRDAQLILRAVVGTRELDQLLADKDAVATELDEGLRKRAGEYGIGIVGAGIRDIILPGEMKVLLNQVIEAEKRAQANGIERREETVATRSLLNTAKLIEQSPTLLRLKELESAERMVASIDQVQILGGGVDALLQQLLPGRAEA